ncbi:hypothetical protein ASPZODRAFT_1671286 [Penicilliopsis zonata CBS 506.65]|uniref:Uncharacterized protein n=1 Tax=Penicilliopsis zonata CBS 506.65 TaxID=1073090 RepID=A0A1L9S4G8_9EURO|nr:hypothetical protein ASPZODRAFT_1671286 [Penicilliopsis zonata CBS 506.65]OJJ42051.1 hypothetical protein ASPZODRAFT_1671286 [Penicilliopsis zonata CBS 506.65]
MGMPLLHTVQTRHVQTDYGNIYGSTILGVTKIETTTTSSTYTRSTDTLRMSESDSSCLEGGSSRSLVQSRAHSQNATLSSYLAAFWPSLPSLRYCMSCAHKFKVVFPTNIAMTCDVSPSQEQIIFIANGHVGPIGSFWCMESCDGTKKQPV